MQKEKYIIDKKYSTLWLLEDKWVCCWLVFNEWQKTGNKIAFVWQIMGVLPAVFSHMF